MKNIEVRESNRAMTLYNMTDNMLATMTELQTLIEEYEDRLEVLGKEKDRLETLEDRAEEFWYYNRVYNFVYDKVEMLENTMHYYNNIVHALKDFDANATTRF